MITDTSRGSEGPVMITPRASRFVEWLCYERKSCQIHWRQGGAHIILRLVLPESLCVTSPSVLGSGWFDVCVVYKESLEGKGYLNN